MKNLTLPFPLQSHQSWNFRAIFSALLIAVLFLLEPSRAHAGENRFEPEIQKFEAMDRLAPPAKNAVLFTGSSSIVYWKNLEADFAGYEVLNRGFGGSQFSDLLHFFDRIIAPYHPQIIVIYSGSHDLHVGKRSPAEVLQMVQTLEGRVRDELPETKIFYISLKPSIAKWKEIALDQEANRLIEEYAGESDTLEFVDIWTPMVAESSPPPERYFQADLNHISEEGYRLWASVIRQHLEQQFSKN